MPGRKEAQEEDKAMASRVWCRSGEGCGRCSQSWQGEIEESQRRWAACQEADEARCKVAAAQRRAGTMWRSFYSGEDRCWGER